MYFSYKLGLQTTFSSSISNTLLNYFGNAVHYSEFKTRLAEVIKIGPTASAKG